MKSVTANKMCGEGKTEDNNLEHKEPFETAAFPQGPVQITHLGDFYTPPTTPILLLYRAVGEKLKQDEKVFQIKRLI